MDRLNPALTTGTVTIGFDKLRFWSS